MLAFLLQFAKRLQAEYLGMKVQASSIKSRCLSYHGFPTVTTGKVQIRISTIVQHSAAGHYEVGVEPVEGGFVDRRKETRQEVEEREMVIISPTMLISCISPTLHISPHAAH